MRTVNVVMLPATQHMGVLSYTPKGKLHKNVLLGKPQDIYFISDEEIKEVRVGDWTYHTDMKGNYIQQVIAIKDSIAEGTISFFNTQNWLPQCGGKIVATTDPTLYTHQKETPIKDEVTTYLPQIPESFILKHIEMFNAGNPPVQCSLEEEEIMTNQEWNEYSMIVAESFHSNASLKRLYELKEKLHNGKRPLPQLKLTPNNEVIVHPIKERTFTLEEVDNLMNAAFVGGWTQANNATDKKPYIGFRDWQEQNHPELNL